MSGRHSYEHGHPPAERRELDPRRAHHGGVATTSPWRRAPILLLRHPAVFLAVVAATAVLAIAAASGVLFVSTLDTASLQAQAAQDCPERSMPAFSAQVSTSGQLPGARKQGLRAMNNRDPLGTPYAVEIGFATVETVPITLYSRPGALDHVEKLRGSDGPGVWFPDDYAKKLHLVPGSTIRTLGGVEIRVAGVYRAMYSSPFKLANVPRYFCNWTDLIIRNAVSEGGIGPLLISDERTIVRAADLAQVSFYDPIPLDSTSVDAAEAANRRADAADISFRTHGGYSDAQDSPYAAAPSATTATLDAMITKARASRDGVGGSILPIDLAGVLVASLLVAAAGAYWAASRSREIRLLVARGVGPGALASKAVLETGPAAILGLLAGMAAAVALVRSVSPSDVLEPGTTTTAAWAAGAATFLGLLMIAVIGAVASRDRLVGIKASWRTYVPWELLLLGLAIFIGLHIQHESNITVQQTVINVHPVLVIFPLIGSLAVLLVFARIAAFALPMIRRKFSGGGTAFYLALRRLAGARAISVGLVVCVALPGALLTYTSTITKSVQDEVVAKYETNVGGARVLTVIGIGNADPDLHGHGTLVSVFGSVPRLPGDVQAYVLGIDPATFSQFALINDDQKKLVDKLHRVPAGDPVPALLVNASSDQPGDTLTMRRSGFTLDIVGRPAVFPGLRVGSQPLVVMDRSALHDLDPQIDRLNQVWTTPQQHDAAKALLNKDSYTILADVTPQTLVSTTGLLPLTWIFDYLRALAVMIGLVAIVGLVFALAARTRQRTVSYVLSRRMGLTRFAHLRTLLLELSVLVGVGYVAGIIVGSGAFRIILGGLDVYPVFPPPPTFTAPTSTWLLTAGVWLVVIAAASVSVQLLADRAKPAEILRLE
jgi:putative ABC transport system permease protein